MAPSNGRRAGAAFESARPPVLQNAMSAAVAKRLNIAMTDIFA